MNYQPIYEATAFDHGFAPKPAPSCPRCTPADSSGVICPPCAGELAAQLANLDDELVSVFHSGHGIQHGTYRADVAL